MIKFCGPNNFFSDNISAKDIIKELSNSDILGLDLETQGRDPHKKKILSLQLSNEIDQYVIDVRHVDILLFKDLIESKLCIGHNLKFDYKFLKKAGIILNDIHDSFVTEMVIHGGYVGSGIRVGYSLLDVVKRYCGVTLNKDTRRDFFNLTSEPFTEAQIEYAAKDVAYLHEVRLKQLERANKYNLLYCVNLENEVVKVLADMEYNGVYVDKEAWAKLAIDNSNKLRDLEIKLDELIAKELKLMIRLSLFGNERLINIDYSSPLQVKQILDKMGLHLEDTSNRTLLNNKNKSPIIPLLLDHRSLAKRVSTYGQTFLRAINPVTGRIHTEFKQIIDTGRIASGRKAKKGDKNPPTPNLQNIPRENTYRNKFKPRNGYSWVSCDYSQQELVIMGEGAKDWDFIKTYNEGGDLHCYVGSLMFEREITKEDAELRTQAKTINFGKAYGMGPGKLADTLDISTEKAIELINRHTKAMPKIDKWLKDQGEIAVKELKSTTFAPCNRIRWFPQLQKPLTTEEIAAIKRQGGNSPVQGTGADICKEALVEVRKLVNIYNKQYGRNVCYLLLTVHDQIDVEVEDALAEQFSNEMQKVMEEVPNKYLKVAKMRVDKTITKQWQK